MTLTVRPKDAPLGAEITGVDLSQPVDEETFAQILEAWHEYMVLVFPDQDLDEDAQAAFARRFGDLVKRKATAGPKNPYAMVISNIQEDGKWIGAAPIGELTFHTDRAFDERPLKATTLYGIEVPSQGGQTVFANMYDVYDALDPETPAPLDHRDEYSLRVAVLLSAQCTDVRVNQVTPKLFGRARTPAAMARLQVEEIEDIEILRFLELGWEVRMVELSDRSFSVDVPADVEIAERLIRDRGL